MQVKKTFSRIGIAALVTLLVNTFISLITNIVTELIAPDILMNEWYSMASTMLPLFLIAYPIGTLIMKSIPNTKNTAPPVQGKLRTLQLLFVVLTSYGIMVLSNLLGLGVLYLSITLFNNEISFNSLDGLIANTSPFITIVFTVILAPIAEELFFRKLLYKKIAIFGDGIFILFSAFIFGMFHANLFQSLYAFALGIILGYVYIYTGKIAYPIIAHIFMNFLGLGIPSLAAHYGGEIASMIWGICTIILAVFGVVLFFKWLWINKKKINLAQGSILIEKKKDIFINVGTILFSIFILITMLVFLLAPIFI